MSVVLYFQESNNRIIAAEQAQVYVKKHVYIIGLFLIVDSYQK